MKNLFILIFSLIFVIGCSKSSGEIKMPPLFKSSQPEENAEGISITTSIEITFDEVVTLAENHGIKVNDESVNASAQFTRITLDVDLEKSKDYHVYIPAGAVINTYGVDLEQPIQFSFSTENEMIIEISENLVSANATPEAVNVYNFLKENYGVKCISAEQSNVAWNINEAEWVRQHTGKYPAIATIDYIHLPFSPANWIDYSQTGFIEDWWSNNGLISASWHWLVPKFNGGEGYVYGTEDYTYKPGETTFKASNVTIEGTWENTLAKADLEKIAGYLKLLQARNIPVIWRPLHEAAGNIYEYPNGTAWFWWGAGGAEVYKDIWIFMFDYFESQGLDNLIWVWNTQTKDDPFYPGDEYVDIVGRDIYSNDDALDIASQFNSIQERFPNKIVTLSELGSVAKMSEQWSAGAKWSYFMSWYDYERTNTINNTSFTSTDHMHANAAWWIDAFSIDYVVTRDQMPDLK